MDSRTSDANVGGPNRIDKTKTKTKGEGKVSQWSCFGDKKNKRTSGSENSTTTVMPEFHGAPKVESPVIMTGAIVERERNEFPFPPQSSKDNQPEASGEVKPEVSEDEKAKQEVLDRIKHKAAKKSDFNKLAKIINDHCKNSINGVIKNDGVLKVDDLTKLQKEISDILEDISFARLKEIYEKIPEAKNPTVESLLSAEGNPLSNFNIELISNRLKKENLQNSKKIIREKFGVRSFKTVISMIEKMQLGGDKKIKEEYKKYVDAMKDNDNVDEGIEKSALRIFLEKHLLDLYRAKKAMESKEDLDRTKEENNNEIRSLEEQERKRKSTLNEDLDASKGILEENQDLVESAEMEVKKRKDTLNEEMEKLYKKLNEKRKYTSDEGIEEIEDLQNQSRKIGIKRENTLNEAFQGMKIIISGISNIASAGVDMMSLANAIESRDIGKIGAAFVNITTSKDVTNLGDGGQEVINGIAQILDGLKESEHIKALKDEILGKINIFKNSRKKMQENIEKSMSAENEAKSKLKKAVEFDDRIEKVRGVIDIHQGKEVSLQTETRKTESIAINEFELLHYVNALTDLMLCDMYKYGKLEYSKEELANNWIGLRDIIYYSVAKKLPNDIEIKGLTTYDPIVLDSAKIALEEVYKKRLRNSALLRRAIMISIRVEARQFKEWATRKVKPLDAEMVLVIAMGAQRQAMKALQKKYGKKVHMHGFGSNANLSAESLSSIAHDFDTQNVSSDTVRTLAQAHSYQFRILEIAKAVQTYGEVDDMTKKVIRSSERLRNERMRHESIRALIGKNFLNIIQDDINNVDNIAENTIENAVRDSKREMNINENIHVLHDFDNRMIIESENATKKVKDAESETNSLKDEKSKHVKKYFSDVLARSTMSNLDRAVKVVSTGLSLAMKFSSFA